LIYVSCAHAQPLLDPTSLDPYQLGDETRTLGLTVLRGTSVMMISPTDGTQEIENPFQAAEEPVIS